MVTVLGLVKLGCCCVQISSLSLVDIISLLSDIISLLSDIISLIDDPRKKITC